MNNTFQIAVLGPKGVGKRTFLHRFLTGEFSRQADILPSNFKIDLRTNYGDFSLNCFVSEEKIAEKTQGCLIFCSRLDSESCKQAFRLSDENENFPRILCGTRCDAYLPHEVRLHTNKLARKLGRRKDIQWYDISAKSNYNFEKPFLSLLRKLTNHDDLIFIEHDAEIPPETEH